VTPFGAFSMMVIQDAGRTVHLKRRVALDKDGAVVGAGDTRAQVHQVLDNIQTALASLGGRMSDVISLAQHTTDIDAFMRFGDVRATFSSKLLSVATTAEVKRLYAPALLIEIPLRRFTQPHGASLMHD